MSSERTEDSGIECEFCGDEFETVGELSKHRIKEHSDRICSKCGDKFSSTPYGIKIGHFLQIPIHNIIYEHS